MEFSYDVHITTFWKCLYHLGLGALSLDLSTRNVDPAVVPILLEQQRTSGVVAPQTLSFEQLSQALARSWASENKFIEYTMEFQIYEMDCDWSL